MGFKFCRKLTLFPKISSKFLVVFIFFHFYWHFSLYFQKSYKSEPLYFITSYIWLLFNNNWTISRVIVEVFFSYCLDNYRRVVFSSIKYKSSGGLTDWKKYFHIYFLQNRLFINKFSKFYWNLISWFWFRYLKTCMFTCHCS